MPDRTAHLTRETQETSVEVHLDLDGSGQAAVSTGVGFFDHLLTSLAHHALFDLTVNTKGDLNVDDHHTVEDTALVLGSAMAEALGDRAGINRFGDAAVPMDEALGSAAVDVGGRPYAVIDLPLQNPMIGNLTTQNLPHALEAMARAAGFTLHLRSEGLNDHHQAEAAIKALARALRQAVSQDPRRQGVASTKGTI
ncbi:MAG: imidazoleglycerol-phosphate dehydratase HisB [bacterium]|nr:imidazoleglycerol-phosphate dehydratase HisB [Acidimicrobiia bacterium]MCY4648754.1 imidazoleglycerol-phosphate dehydratase HisB [bacterium]